MSKASPLTRVKFPRVKTGKEIRFLRAFPGISWNLGVLSKLMQAIATTTAGVILWMGKDLKELTEMGINTIVHLKGEKSEILLLDYIETVPSGGVLN